ncbi:hypothetical protein JTB14_000610 [Gonioctena quinquepunctata]|nr:hypothetical protein JTB14_000610 [Gonioctena quinquepunctata]
MRRRIMIDSTLKISWVRGSRPWYSSSSSCGIANPEILDENSSDHFFVCQQPSIPNDSLKEVPTFNNHNSLNAVEKLKKWAVENKVTLSAINQLLAILVEAKPDDFHGLPRDARTFLATPKLTITREVDPGEYYHFGIQKSLEDLFKKNCSKPTDPIQIGINIDGLPIAKSSNSQFYPILGLESKNVFLIGLYHGYEKPKNFNQFLSDFVEEAIQLNNNGVEIFGHIYNFKITKFLFDAVAKASILAIKGHAGYSSCTKCSQHGESIQDRVCFPLLTFEKRTHESFVQQTDACHHSGHSILLDIPNIDIIADVPLDYMHLVLLGVVKKLLCGLWMPWVIVKFSDSEEIEAVPSCWYDSTRKTISYPPFPRNRMEKAIKNELDPGDDWREYSVTLMRDTLYDNFRTACSKASKCCVTSEISEPEYLSDKRRPKKKLNSSEEDSSSDLDIPVPKARKGTNQIKKNIGDSQEDSAPQMDSTNMSHKSNQASSSDPGTEMENFEVQNIPSSDLKFRKTCIEILVKNCKLLKECTRNIQELSEKVDTLTGLMKRQSLTAVENTNIMLLDFFLDFPIKNVQMLDHVEKILENEEAFKRLIDGLTRIGGKDYKECCRRFLKKVLDDKFAAEYSLVGHKHKKVFKSLKICSCILEAIQRCNKEATLKEIEIVVSAYLAKSNDRLKRQQDIQVETEETA